MTKFFMLILCCSLLVSPSVLYAGTNAPKTLTLREAILLAMRMNPLIQGAEIQRIADKFTLEAAYYQFQPQLGIAGNVTYSETVDQGQTTRTTQNSIGPQIRYKNVYGTEFELNPQNQASINNADPFAFNPQINFQVRQPLLRGSGREVVEAQLNQSIINEFNNRLALQGTLIDTITNVITVYYQVILDRRNLSIQKLAVVNDQITIKTYKAKIKAGELAPAELNDVNNTLYQDRLNLVTLQNQLLNDQQSLLVLLGLNPQSNIEIVEDVQINQIKIPDIQSSIQYALKHNLAYQQSLNVLAQSEIQLLTAKDATRWKLDATGGISVGNPNGTGSSGTFKDFVNGKNTNKLVRIDLDIPINDKALQAQMVNARVQLSRQQLALKNQKRQLETSIINAIQTLQANKANIDLAIKTREYAKRSYRVTLKKIAVGRSTTFELTTKSRELTQAEQQVVSAEIAYLINYANFESILAKTLDFWGLHVKT